MMHVNDDITIGYAANVSPTTATTLAEGGVPGGRRGYPGSESEAGGVIMVPSPSPHSPPTTVS